MVVTTGGDHLFRVWGYERECPIVHACALTLCNKSRAGVGRGSGHFNQVRWGLNVTRKRAEVGLVGN